MQALGNKPADKKSEKGVLYKELLEAFAKWGEAGEAKALQLSQAQTKSLSAEELKKRAERFGFHCHNVASDGNCFFHAVLHQLQQQDQKKYEGWTDLQLREQTVQHILDNLADYKEFLGEDSNEFINKISQHGVWAENVVVPALSHALNITLVIIVSDDERPRIYKRPNPVAVVYLGYQAGVHYQSLVSDKDSKVVVNIQDFINKAELDNWQPGIKKAIVAASPPTPAEQLIMQTTSFGKDVASLVMAYVGVDVNHTYFFQAFEAKAEAKETQGLPAVFSEPKLSYSELNKRANQLAHFLLAKKQQLHLQHDTVVGLFFYQSLDYVVSVLAAMKAGLAFMPLSANTEIPTQRLVDYIQGSNVKILLTHSSLKSRNFLASDQLKTIGQFIVDEVRNETNVCPTTNPGVKVTLDQLAYVHNTSGSTGVPKKVLIKHRGIMNCVRAHIDLLKLDEKQHVAAFADIAFDAHIIEVMMTLAAGACLYPMPADIRTDLTKLKHFYGTNNITVSIFTPSMLRELSRENFPSLRVIISTGEEVTKEIVKKWQPVGAPPLLFINGYGPAEVTIATSMAVLKPDEEVHIGGPIPGLRMLVLAILEEGVKVPNVIPRVNAGERGELYIAGEGLGSYADAKLNTERFFEITDPDNPAQKIPVYRTRDAAELKEDKFYLKGRLDRQLKFYGKLIDPQEIEELLTKSGGNILHAYVDAKKDGGEHPYLIAYVELQDKTQALQLRKLYDQLARKLTVSMVPTRWVVVDKMDLSPSLKVDGKKLLASPATQQKPLRVPGLSNIKVSDIKSNDNLELELANLWREVLKFENDFVFYVDHNFTELGGTSLQLASLLGELRNKYDLRLSAEEFFHSPTIAALSRRIRRKQKQSPEMPEVTLLVDAKAEVNTAPLFLIHSLMGDPELDYEKLKSSLISRPVYVIRARGLNNPNDMDDNLVMIAADYIQAIRKKQPHDPYLLGGWSAGGVIAFAMAVQLRSKGEEVSILMIDSEPPNTYQAKSNLQYAAFLLHLFKNKLAGRLGIASCDIKEEDLAKKSPQEQIHFLFAYLLQQVAKVSADSKVDAKAISNANADVKQALLVTIRDILLAMLGYQMSEGLSDVTLLAASATQADCKSERLNWPANVVIEKIIKLEGNHESIVLDPKSAPILAKHINEWCTRQTTQANIDVIVRQLRASEQPELNRKALEYYIPVNARLNPNDRDVFDLERDEKNGLMTFLKSNKKVLLLWGDAGAGKTLFCQYLAIELSQAKSLNDVIVLYIPLVMYLDPLHELIEKSLKQAGLSGDQIKQLKKSKQRFVFILDGFDEIKSEHYSQNLYMTNRLWEWNAHVIISCRNSYLLNASGDRFRFMPAGRTGNGIDREAFREVTLASFRDDQIKSYIEKYVNKKKNKKSENDEKFEDALTNESVQWSADQYWEWINRLPGLKPIVTSPFLLSVLMDVLPTIVEKYNDDHQMLITESIIMDHFVASSFDRELVKVMQNAGLPPTWEDPSLEFSGFAHALAMEMCKYDPPLVYIDYRPTVTTPNPWKRFFSDREEDMVVDVYGNKIRPQDMHRAREGCMDFIRKFPSEKNDGTQRWGFVHYKMQEYFAATGIYKHSLTRDSQLDKETMAGLYKKPNDTKEGIASPPSLFFAPSPSVASASTAAAGVDRRDTKTDSKTDPRKDPGSAGGLATSTNKPPTAAAGVSLSPSSPLVSNKAATAPSPPPSVPMSADDELALALALSME